MPYTTMYELLAPGLQINQGNVDIFTVSKEMYTYEYIQFLRNLRYGTHLEYVNRYKVKQFFLEPEINQGYYNISGKLYPVSPLHCKMHREAVSFIFVNAVV
jgi:hypothetical protein